MGFEEQPSEGPVFAGAFLLLVALTLYLFFTH
jgi:hypothetical protein